MKAHEAMPYLVKVSGRSQRDVSRTLGKAGTWASNLIRTKADSKLSTIADVADLAGVDVCLVDRATGETIATIEPPRRGED